MISLYIHIPFCRHKCKYCSFFVMPAEELGSAGQDKQEQIKEQYFQSLLAEIAHRHQQFPDQQLRTIYIGGGTPFELGKQRLLKLIDTVLDTRDTEFLEELTIELNPDPFDEVIDFISTANQQYRHLYKLRFSIGIQTFDDEILTESKRNYVFNNLIRFFRDLQKIKQPHTHYNFDFIAFGKQDGLPRSQPRIDFFEKLVASHVADGYSLYTLELFPGSHRYHQQHQKTLQRYQGNDEQVAQEFTVLQDIITAGGYHRYEISNFALLGKQSNHNMVYRTLQPYLGLGINSASFLPAFLLDTHSSSGHKSGSPCCPKILNLVQHDTKGVRFQNTKHRKSYLQHHRLDTESITALSSQDIQIERAFLALRTDDGLQQVSTYAAIFEDDWEQLLATRAEQGFVLRDPQQDTLRLSDDGMRVYNALVTDLFSSFGD